MFGDAGEGNLEGTGDRLLVVNDTGGPVTVAVLPGSDQVGIEDSHVAVLVDDLLATDATEVEDVVFAAGDAGDTFLVSGDFSGTDVSPATFVFYGGAGGDIADASALSAPHGLLAYGGGGEDSLTGGGGNDALYGDADADNLVGDARDGAAEDSAGGNDLLDGGAGNDILVGDVGPGDGVLDLDGSPLDFAGFDPGDDTLFGGSGDDDIVGDLQGDLTGAANGTGDDLIYGGDGVDLISGDVDGDIDPDGDGGTIRSGARGGADKIYGGGDSDFIFGDSLHLRDGGLGGDDQIYGGAVGDSIQGDTFFDIQGAGSRGGNDTIYGGEGGDLIDGDAAQSQISDGAAGGADLIYGGNGDDAIAGDLGALTGSGNGEGVLTSGLLYGGSGGDDTIYGEAGNDEIFGDVRGSLGAVTGETDSRAGNDTLYGGSGGDTLYGDAGIGSFFEPGRFDSFIDNGNGGDDTLYGGSGDDTLYGNSGSDSFFWSLGDGSDTVFGGTNGKSVFDDQDSDLLILAGDGESNSFEINLDDAGPRVEAVVDGTTLFAHEVEDISIDGGGGADAVTIGDLTGTPTSVSTITIEGGDGEDSVDAGAITAGRPVGVVFYGGEDDDAFEGGAGNDVFYGGGGDDTARYSGAQEGYVVTPGDGFVVVMDNTPGRDGTDTLFGVETVEFSISPVAHDFAIGGEIPVGIEVSVSATDIVAEFGSDADSDLSATSLSFDAATVDGAPTASLADIGFSYSPGAGDAGGFMIVTDGAPAFAGLAPGRDGGRGGHLHRHRWRQQRPGRSHLHGDRHAGHLRCGAELPGCQRGRPST